MKNRLWFVLGMTSLFILSSCNEDKVVSDNQLVRSISVTGQDFLDGDATRAAYTVDGTGFHFSWTQGDTVGIYPVGGDQVAFPISSGEGGQTAQFDGGAWILRSTYSYAAYYPFSSGNYHIEETCLPVSYVGQRQNGNGSLEGLDRYDYQASIATTPNEDNKVNIFLKHLGCFVRLQLTMPVADTYKSVTLQSDKTPFVLSGTYDLTKEDVAITPTTTSSSIKIGLDNITITDDNKILTIYAMLAPLDLSSSEITVIVEGTLYKYYSATVTGKNMLAGKAYSYNTSVQSGININGADVEWDENGEENILTQYEYVDLGLSVNWATFNVGAYQPEGYGEYFAWGETDVKSEYSWTTYSFCDGTVSSMTKYNTTDNKVLLDLNDDVAHVKWNDNWRTPTKEEFQELIDNCTWVWATQNGVKGYLVTSKKTGYNSRSIFLPLAGYFYYWEPENVGTTGFYGSVSLYNANSQYMYQLHIGNGFHKIDNGERYRGYSIRPVCTSEDWYNNLSITIGNNTGDVIKSCSLKLSADVFNGNENVNYIVGDSIKWSSDNTSIAVVDENGVVKGLSLGTVTITASCCGKTQTCTITVREPDYNGHEYVDLGLSVKWATCNIDAESPEEYGGYYAYGEIETKENYSWTTHKWCEGSWKTLIKYKGDKRVLDLEDDVANVKLGGDWHIPSKDEFQELIDNCTVEKTTINDVNGVKMISKIEGYTDKSIFIPFGGFYSETYLQDNGSYGYYMSNTLNSRGDEGTYWVCFASFIAQINGNYDRHLGLTVRPVCP